jgi:peptidoglycan/LPS O-acetylase OafA/YrhL
MNHNDKYVALDLLRGMAALLVCAGHIRNFLFVDYGEVANPSLFDKLFYFGTGIGHQAVIVFFVLSGFFVGGSVWGQLRKDEFRWSGYLFARLSRLWVVLIPALLATWCFDSLGMFITDNAGYDGRWKGLLSSGPGVGADGIALSPLAFLGNALFLQTIALPVFGTNGPLWSLAYEFCYYLIFPVLGLALVKRAVGPILALVLMISVFAYLPADLQSGFLFWLLGWLAAIAGKSPFRAGGKYFVPGLAAFGVALAGSKLTSGLMSELVVAVATAALLLVLPHVKLGKQSVVRAAMRLSDMSFSLYLFHFPFVAFIWYVFIAPVQQQPTMAGLGQFLALLALTLVFCFCMWLLFERHTSRIRIVLRGKLRAVF